MANDLIPATNKKQREEIYKAMTPACQEVALEIERLDQQVRKGVALVAYDVGVNVKTVLSDEVKYGMNGVPQIAAYMNYPGGADALNRCRDLVTSFPRRDQYAKALGIFRMDGRPLELGHMQAVAKLEDRDSRDKLLQFARENNMGVNQFEEHVKANYDRKNPRKGCGRKQKLPKSHAARFQTGYSNALKLKNYLELMADPTFAEVQELPAEEIEAKLLTKLEEFETQLVDVQATIQQVLTDLVPAKEYLLKCQDGETVDDVPEAEAEAEETVPVRPAKKKPAAAKPAPKATKAPAKAKRRRPAPV